MEYYRRDNRRESFKKPLKKMEQFFHSLGILTKLSEYTEAYNGTAEKS